VKYQKGTEETTATIENPNSMIGTTYKRHKIEETEGNQDTYKFRTNLPCNIIARSKSKALLPTVRVKIKTF